MAASMRFVMCASDALTREAAAAKFFDLICYTTSLNNFLIASAQLVMMDSETVPNNVLKDSHCVSRSSKETYLSVNSGSRLDAEASTVDCSAALSLAIDADCSCSCFVAASS